jgi:hypothetical protein
MIKIADINFSLLEHFRSNGNKYLPLLALIVKVHPKIPITVNSVYDTGWAFAVLPL